MIEKASLHQLQALEADQTETLKLQEIKIYKIITVHVFFSIRKIYMIYTYAQFVIFMELSWLREEHWRKGAFRALRRC